jgi:hypothetical protein
VESSSGGFPRDVNIRDSHSPTPQRQSPRIPATIENSPNPLELLLIYAFPHSHYFA